MKESLNRARDLFTEGASTPRLRDEYGLDNRHIVAAAREARERKS